MAMHKILVNFDSASMSKVDTLNTHTLKEDSLRALSYHVTVFGCQMNKDDSENIRGLLESFGAHPAESAQEANIAVFLTCCVREAADKRFLGQAHSLKNSTPEGGVRIIAVGGCVAQRDRDKLFDEIPHIDLVFGTHNIAELPELLWRAINSSERHQSVIEAATDPFIELPRLRENDFRAWLSISKGCNNFCSYCIVPYVRGREVSLAIEEIEKRAIDLVADGVKEITLLGQNVNSYGHDLYGRSCFDEVLRAVSATGVPRIRFTTSHPKDLNGRIIKAFSELENVMPQLHLPVQSGSDRILGLMNRGYGAADYMELISKIKTARPDVALSTDIIVGFPGETEEDFLQTLKLVRDVSYSQAFTFIYSNREGTKAASFEQNSTRGEIQSRFEQLVEEIQVSALRENKKDEGRLLEVLVEGPSKRDPKIMSGSSPKNQTVHFKAANDTIGKILNVKITESKTWYLNGELI
jgi:tRNA-2-methylthio-N6-dimethylallyladenosine synthase